MHHRLALVSSTEPRGPGSAGGDVSLMHCNCQAIRNQQAEKNQAMRTTIKRQWAHLVCLALGTLLGAVGANAMTDDDSVWIRIHQPADSNMLNATRMNDRLTDYGSFQWGQISRSEAQALAAAGIPTTVHENPFVLTLGEQRFDPLTRFPETTLSLPEDQATSPDFRLVQFRGPVRQQWLDQLSARGIVPIQYIHPYTYVVWADRPSAEQARALGPVRWSGDFLPEFRVLPRHRGIDDRPGIANLLVSRYASLETLLSELDGQGTRILGVSDHGPHLRVISALVAANRHMDLGRVPGVYSVQPGLKGAPRDEMTNQSIVSDQFTSNQDITPGYQDWLNTHGYDGSGVIVGLIDGGILESHVDLVDNMVECVAHGSPTSCTTSNNSHGTHVAGAVAGTGASGKVDGQGFLKGQGVAPGASLVQQRYNSPGLIYDWGGSCDAGEGSYCLSPESIPILFREAALSGAALTNNSWGSPGFGYGYDLPTQQVDAFARDANPDTPYNVEILPIWAVQNGGGDFTSAGCGPASMGSPEEAKNVFAVGATELRPGSTIAGVVPNPSDIYSVAPNSAHGPACDGRTVPHIVAPGCFTQSTDSSLTQVHSTKCGTSMAAPVVSGAAALFIERYRDLYATGPSPALIKAALAAAAVNLEGRSNADGNTMGHRPDRFQGFGRIDLDAVINPTVDVFYLDQEVLFSDSGQSWSLAFEAADPDRPVSIMLTWTDATGHGLGGSTPAWVNDLDLLVTAADSSLYLGNVIGQDGWSATGGQTDSRNNMEAVYLDTHQHGGSFTIEIAAAEIAADALNPHSQGLPRQDFALACYNCSPAQSSFTLELQPERLAFCIPESEPLAFNAQVTVNAIGNPQDSVMLQSSGEPAGVSTMLDPDVLAAPGQATWQWSIDSSAQPGTTAVTLTADDGSQGLDRTMLLSLSAVPEPPTAIFPGDGAMDVDLLPSFEWQAVDNAIEYQVQAATDAAFSHVVFDERITAENFQPANRLQSDTRHYWRIQATNNCGSGQWSAPLSFTTRTEPRFRVQPESVQKNLLQGAVGSVALDIANIGTGTLAWSVTSDEQETDATDRIHAPELDETLTLPAFTLAPWDNSTASAMAGQASRGHVVGFSYSGTVSGISETGAWASDMALNVVAPDGRVFSVGGYETGYPPWDFQGGSSGNDGTYRSTHVGSEVFGLEGAPDHGIWGFEFNNTWNFGMQWSAVQVTLHKSPLPYCIGNQTWAEWLSPSMQTGSIAAGSSQAVELYIDATNLTPGQYLAYLCFQTNDPKAALVTLPVELWVGEPTLFRDRFEQQ
jgi:serine protease AprX